MSTLNFYETRAHEAAVAEYASSFRTHLSNLEALQCTPMHTQGAVLALRAAALNSIYDTVCRVGWQSSTFSLTVHLLDSYCCKVAVNHKYYRLVAFCCLWIASKYNERKPKGKLVDALIKRAGYTLAEKPQFLRTEAAVLDCVGWDLSHPSTESFLDLMVNNAVPNNVERRYGALFLCELAHFCPEIALQYSPSDVVRSAIVITNVALLNLRHKYIWRHHFRQLDTLLLKSVQNIPNALRHQYFARESSQYSGTFAVVCNLVDLAASFLRQQHELSRQKSGISLLQATGSPIRECRQLAPFPMSPISSPTRRQGSPGNLSVASPIIHFADSLPPSGIASQPCSGQLGRSLSASSSFFTRSFGSVQSIPTPRSTPSATVFAVAAAAAAGASVAASSSSPQTYTPTQLVAPAFHFSHYRVPSLPGVPLFTQPKPTSVIASNDLSCTVSSDERDAGRCLKKRRV